MPKGAWGYLRVTKEGGVDWLAGVDGRYEQAQELPQDPLVSRCALQSQPPFNVWILEKFSTATSIDYDSRPHALI